MIPTTSLIRSLGDLQNKLLYFLICCIVNITFPNQLLDGGQHPHLISSYMHTYGLI